MPEKTLQVLLPSIQINGIDLRKRRLTPEWNNYLTKSRTNWVKQNINNPEELFDPKKYKTRTSLTDTDWNYIYSQHPEYFDPAGKYRKQIPDKYLSKQFNKGIRKTTDKAAAEISPWILGFMNPLAVGAGMVSLMATDEITNEASGGKYLNFTQLTIDKLGPVAGTIVGIAPGMIGGSAAAKSTYVPSYTTNARIIERDPSLIKEAILDVNKNIVNYKPNPTSTGYYIKNPAKYGVTPNKPLDMEVSKGHFILYLKQIRPFDNPSLKFFERPSKLSIREKFGLPKGTKKYTPEENIAFRKQINDFASKYGYEPIGEEVTDPEVLERYARSLIKRHNTFFRGVRSLNQKSDPELWALLEKNLGKNFTEEQALKYMATHTPGGGAGELYISPYSQVAGLYGHIVEVTKPFKLGTDRTKWFIEGDFPLVENASHRANKYYDYFSGLTDPWNMGELYGMKTGNISKAEALLWYKPSYYKPNTGGIPSEITARNLTLIPQRISYRASYGARDWKLGNPNLLGSRKITDTPWLFTSITEKNGGKLNYTKFFK